MPSTPESKMISNWIFGCLGIHQIRISTVELILGS